MKVAIVPLSVVAKAGGRLDAEFYCDPGKPQRERAAKTRARAAKLLLLAAEDEASAAQDVEQSSKLGVRVIR